MGSHPLIVLCIAFTCLAPGETTATGALFSGPPVACGSRELFSYHDALFAPHSSLSISVQSIDHETGEVTINGVDTQCPTIPFTWDWNDESPIIQGWFPQTHTYTDLGATTIRK